jgi:hypothetical protein
MNISIVTSMCFAVVNAIGLVTMSDKCLRHKTWFIDRSMVQLGYLDIQWRIQQSNPMGPASRHCGAKPYKLQ